MGTDTSKPEQPKLWAALFEFGTVRLVDWTRAHAMPDRNNIYDGCGRDWTRVGPWIEVPYGEEGSLSP